MSYILESGNPVEQERYQELLKNLDKLYFDPKLRKRRLCRERRLLRSFESVGNLLGRDRGRHG